MVLCGMRQHRLSCSQQLQLGAAQWRNSGAMAGICVECITGFMDVEVVHMPQRTNTEKCAGGLDLHIQMNAGDWICKRFLLYMLLLHILSEVLFIQR